MKVDCEITILLIVLNTETRYSLQGTLFSLFAILWRRKSEYKNLIYKYI